MQNQHRYEVINKRTSAIVGKYSTYQRAKKSADKKDCIYGAYVHIIREVTTEKSI